MIFNADHSPLVVESRFVVGQITSQYQKRFRLIQNFLGLLRASMKIALRVQVNGAYDSAF